MVGHKFTLVVAKLLRGKKVSHQKKKYQGEKSLALKGKVSRRKKKSFGEKKNLSKKGKSLTMKEKVSR